MCRGNTRKIVEGDGSMMHNSSLPQSATIIMIVVPAPTCSSPFAPLILRCSSHRWLSHLVVWYIILLLHVLKCVCDMFGHMFLKCSWHVPNIVMGNVSENVSPQPYKSHTPFLRRITPSLQISYFFVQSDKFHIIFCSSFFQFLFYVHLIHPTIWYWIHP